MENIIENLTPVNFEEGNFEVTFNVIGTTENTFTEQNNSIIEIYSDIEQQWRKYKLIEIYLLSNKYLCANFIDALLRRKELQKKEMEKYIIENRLYSKLYQLNTIEFSECSLFDIVYDVINTETTFGNKIKDIINTETNDVYLQSARYMQEEINKILVDLSYTISRTNDILTLDMYLKNYFANL